MAPQQITNKEFSKALAKSLSRPAFIPVPPLALRILFGEGAKTIIKGQNVIPERLSISGFKFKYRTIEEAYS